MMSVSSQSQALFLDGERRVPHINTVVYLSVYINLAQKVTKLVNHEHIFHKYYKPCLYLHGVTLYPILLDSERQLS